MTQRILIISYSPIARDPRVMRQIRALGKDYALTVVGLGPAPAEELDFIEVLMPRSSFLRKAKRALQLITRSFESAYWQSHLVRASLAKLQGKQFDLVIANDVIAVPLALRAAAGAPVLFDGHEYSPREFEDSLLWRIFLQRYMRYLCTRYLPATSASMTVCKGIADEYRRHFNINPVVVYNSPAPQDLPAHPVDATHVRLIHHGIAARARQLDLMIDMMKDLDERFTLDLMLINSDPSYMNELRQRAADEPRISFLAPVPMEHISATINHHDIGVFLLPPVNFNYHFALPNKFFEFMQARLAIAIGPSPEMASLVNEWGLGIVTEDFEPSSLARRLNSLSADDINQMKQRTAKAAKQLHAGVVTQQLRTLVADTLGHPPPRA